ncbi:hypothetical protein [Sporolactobacillus spathodeae]|uniref:Uncharacterized protein n=1 Tax=Sporolactobacillus spathodeae TaxID=1465502 RepID=A0ABS2Q617_9BACL|nr:hypothetical protein [Sporolactobacillus spathodeae]MBM7657213.1 hypothetical protein [Sporolactobacillus spathodeae]
MADDEEKTYFETTDIRRIVKDLFRRMETVLEMSGFDIASGLHEPYSEDITFYFETKKSIREPFTDPVNGGGGRKDNQIYQLTIYTGDGITEGKIKDILEKFIKRYH